MDFTHVTAGTDDDGRRLDKIIRRFLNDASLSHLYGALRKGLVKVDGKKQTPDFHVRAGSDIAIANVLLHSTQMHADAHGWGADTAAKTIADEWVLFRNEHLLILNKPYNLSVQKARGSESSLADMVQDDYRAHHAENGSLSFRPGPLHRLDKKTTGIIVFSQSLRGAQWFSAALQTHAIRKTYLALVEGHLAEPQDWQDALADAADSADNTPLSTDGTNYNTQNLKKSAKSVLSARKFHTVTLAETGKRAHTIATPLAYGSYHGKAVTLVRCDISTGRKHQIRAQAAHHGFPLLGDTAYGGTAISETQDFFLHAHRLGIGENPLGLPPEIQSDISTNFAKMLSICLIKYVHAV